MHFCEGRLVLDAVDFDLDGTLSDSTDVYIRILNTAFERIGLPEVSRNVALVAIRESGFNWNKVLPEYLGEQRDKMVPKAMEVIREIYPRMLRQGYADRPWLSHAF
jgi:phosphoglycolate phosphatase-like HAD superfamily hydrolase